MRGVGVFAILAVLTSAASGETPPVNAAGLAAAGRLLAAMHYADKLRMNRADPATVVDGALTDCERDRVTETVCTQRVARARQLAEAAAASRDAIVPDIIAAAQNAYAKYLSVPEMDEVTAFYLSAAGQRLLIEQPAIDVDLRAAEGGILLKWLASQEQAK